MSQNSLNPQRVDIAGWTLRMRVPQGKGPYPVLLMLHGWTGDEEAMWIFADRLPKSALLISPRGLYKTSKGGYSWYRSRQKEWPVVEDFSSAIEALRGLIHSGNLLEADINNVRMVGFSQGAALALVYTLAFPDEVRSVASLSGFLPIHAERLAEGQPLRGKPIFLAHGIRDELVPVELARQAVRILQTAGGKVLYCEDDVGHRLSTSCFWGLQNFFDQT